jgi:hypothetical protein
MLRLQTGADDCEVKEISLACCAPSHAVSSALSIFNRSFLALKAAASVLKLRSFAACGSFCRSLCRWRAPFEWLLQAQRLW